MIIELLTYLRVASDGVAVPAVTREHAPGEDYFLGQHVTKLQEHATRGDAPRAEFREEYARELFDLLLTGSEDQFLNSATEFTKRLIAEMDRRSTSGLLVFLRYRADSNAPLAAAILKLQVVSAYAGIIQEVADGSLTLQAVKNVLDSPGKIQKGVAYPDSRGDSELLVGDRLGQSGTADYFIRAMGIQIDAKPAEAALALIQAVNEEVPQATPQVVAKLPEIERGTCSEVLHELSASVPGVRENLEAISAHLEQRTRPVRNVDTRVGTKLHIVAGSITISGPAQHLDDVTSITQDSEIGRWKTSLTTVEEPEKRYKK